MGLLADILRFLWRRDSDSAAMLAIVIAGYMTGQHHREIGDYFHALRRLPP
jgi:hypothetical protein